MKTHQPKITKLYPFNQIFDRMDNFSTFSMQIKQILSTINGGQNRCLVLKGPNGSGKSFYTRGFRNNKNSNGFLQYFLYTMVKIGIIGVENIGFLNDENRMDGKKINS